MPQLASTGSVSYTHLDVYKRQALILLLIWIQVAAATAPHVCGLEKDKTLLGFSDRKELNMEYLAAYLILFTICLLTVARIIPCLLYTSWLFSRHHQNRNSC